jgi:hypothetical protein
MCQTIRAALNFLPAGPISLSVPPHPAGTDYKEVTVKLRVYKLAFALASIAAFIEVLGAGRRF